MRIPAYRSHFSDAKFVSNIQRQVGPDSKPQTRSNIKSLPPQNKYVANTQSGWQSSESKLLAEKSVIDLFYFTFLTFIIKCVQGQIF